MKTKQAKPVQPALYDGPLEPLLTIPDVVRLLQVSRRTVYTLIDKGDVRQARSGIWPCLLLHLYEPVLLRPHQTTTRCTWGACAKNSA
jgi:hypothetical protein